jgi:hypothetical protein
MEVSQCAWRTIAKAKHRSQWSVIGDQNLLSRAPPSLKDTLSRWSRLHLQSLAPLHHSQDESRFPLSVPMCLDL